MGEAKGLLKAAAATLVKNGLASIHVDFKEGKKSINISLHRMPQAGKTNAVGFQVDV